MGPNAIGNQPAGFTWQASGRQAAVLLATALILGCALWAVRPDRLPLRADPSLYEIAWPVPTVDVAAALRLYEAGDHLFIDTRPDAGPDTPTVPGAFIIRLATLADDLRFHFDYLGPADPLVLFGDGDLAELAYIATRLQERGYPELLILTGGFSAWLAAGGPVAPGAELPAAGDQP
jgi:rhodanese-related sulfurtransferase